MIKNISKRDDSLSPRIKNLSFAVYAVALLFWLWVFYNTPYLHDDWYWGNAFGINALLTGNTNGRYMGNLYIVLITRSALLKTVLCGFIIWLIPFCISRLEPSMKENQKLGIFIFANLMIFLVHHLQWEETIGWLAGFANYVTSGLCLVIFYLVLRKSFSGETSASWKKMLVLFVFMFVAALFVENISIYFVLVSFAALLIKLFRKKEFKTELAMFAGALFGLIFMFSSPSYAGLLQGKGSELRKLTVTVSSSVLDMMSRVLGSVYNHLPGMFEINTFLCIMVLLSAAALLWVQFKDRKALTAVLVSLNALLGLLLLFYGLGGSLPELLMNEDGNTQLSLVLFVLISIEMLLLVFLGRDRADMLRLSFLWFSVLLVILPLTVTKSGGERLYFSIMVLCTLFCAETYVYLTKKGHIGVKLDKALLIVMACACLGIAANTANAYRVIGNINREHLDIIAQAKQNGDKKISIPEYLPNHDRYLADWALDSEQTNPYVVVFKEFYGIDPDVELIVYYRE